MSLDFANETTMTRPRKDVVNFMILDTLQKTLEAYQAWEDSEESPFKERTFKSRLLQLTALIATPLTKKLQSEKPSKTLTEFRKEIKEANYEQTYPLLDYLEKFLYEKDVTKWDTKEQWDRTNILESNRRTHGID